MKFRNKLNMTILRKKKKNILIPYAISDGHGEFENASPTRNQEDSHTLRQHVLLETSLQVERDGLAQDWDDRVY